MLWLVAVLGGAHEPHHRTPGHRGRQVRPDIREPLRRLLGIIRLDRGFLQETVYPSVILRFAGIDGLSSIESQDALGTPGGETS